MRTVLLNPGPVTLSERVKRAVISQDLCHREAEFFDLQDQVRASLLDIYGLNHSEWSAVLLGGSGTTALEAMIASLIPETARVLVIENGVYGERISNLAAIHGVPHTALHLEWGEAIDHQQVEQHLASGDFTHLAVVHHETTTGRLNDIHGLVALCEQYAVDMVLDGVSSFAAEDIPFSSPRLLACAATANKCLHGITGLAMVIARQDGLSQAVSPARSLYLDLKRWHVQQGKRSTPFTPSVQALLGLREALQELEDQGGWQARRRRYRRLASQVTATLEKLGIASLLPAEDSSCVLRSYHLPEGMSYEVLHQSLKQRGFVIYAGQGGLAQKMFRISTMGDISDYDMARLDAAFQDVLSAGRQ